MIQRLLTKVFGSKHERDVKRLQPQVAAINALEPEIAALGGTCRRLGPARHWLDFAFHGEGVAIHSTFWHNNFGEPMSHGCVNVRPEDALWIFRWTMPHVPFD